MMQYSVTFHVDMIQAIQCRVNLKAITNIVIDG